MFNIEILNLLLDLDLEQLKKIREKIEKNKCLKKIQRKNNQLYNSILKNNIELNNLKSTVDFIITNYSSKTTFKQLFEKLLELNIKNFILTTQDCINTVYYISAKTQSIYTDGTIEYGIYNKKYQELENYTQKIVDSNYVIIMNKENPLENIIKVSNINIALKKIPSKDELNILSHDKQKLSDNTKNVNEILNILEIKEKTIKLENLIINMLKRNVLNSERKEDLKKELASLYNIIKISKNIEIELENKIIKNGMSDEILKDILVKRKVKE